MRQSQSRSVKEVFATWQSVEGLLTLIEAIHPELLLRHPASLIAWDVEAEDEGVAKCEDTMEGAPMYCESYVCEATISIV